MIGLVWGPERLDPFPYIPRGWSLRDRNWLSPAVQRHPESP